MAVLGHVMPQLSFSPHSSPETLFENDGHDLDNEFDQDLDLGDSLLYDSILEDENLASHEGENPSDGAPGKKIKPKKNNGRKGPGPIAADRRATHNAIERARRESLNGRFLTLAEALPNMTNVKRPSKSVIVNRALDFVFEAQVKEHALVKENNDLRQEVDLLRSRLGMAPLPPPVPLVTAKKETAKQARAAAKKAAAAPQPLQQPSPTMTNASSPSLISSRSGSFAEQAAGTPSSTSNPFNLDSTHGNTGLHTPAQSVPLMLPEIPLSASPQSAPTFPSLALPPQHPQGNSFDLMHHGAFMQPHTMHPYGGLSPQSLLAQQQALLFAAHLQQQHQQQQSMVSNGNDMFASWTGLAGAHSPPLATAYGPLEAFPFLP